MDKKFEEEFVGGILKEGAIRPEVAKHLAVLLAVVHAKLKGSPTSASVRQQIDGARRMSRKSK